MLHNPVASFGNNASWPKGESFSDYVTEPTNKRKIVALLIKR